MKQFVNLLKIELNKFELFDVNILFFLHLRFQFLLYFDAQFINDDDNENNTINNNNENLHSRTIVFADICFFSKKKIYLLNSIDYYIIKSKIVFINAKKFRITFRIFQFESKRKSKIFLRLNQLKQI